MNIVDNSDSILLAWCGWEIPVRADWRPLRIDGLWDRGEMIVGNAESAIFQLKWWRPNMRTFDARKWIERRVRGWRADAVAGAPSPKGFDLAAFLPEVPSKGGGTRALWYGHAPAAGLVLEMAINGAVDAETARWLHKKALTDLRTADPSAGTQWALYHASFSVPAGFKILDWSLFSGDIAMRFTRPGGDVLIVRQVYPADIALSRRRLERWLMTFPFKEHRRYTERSAPSMWTVQTNGRTFTGLHGYGGRQLAFPLNWAGRRHSHAAGVVDTELDRVLLARHDSKRDAGDVVVREAIAGMNLSLPVHARC